MTLTLSTYFFYIILSIGLVLLVGNILGKTGKAILRDYFGTNHVIADNVNRLVLLGFYLLTIGYISLSTHTGMAIRNYEQMFEILSYKVGVILLVLAGFYFLNLWILFRLRKKKMGVDSKVERSIEEYVIAV